MAVSYTHLLEDLAEREKASSEKSVSLLLSERKTERDELESKRQARLKARQAAGAKHAEEITGELDDGLDASERRLNDRKKREELEEAAKNHDPYLDQAVRIMGDVIAFADPKTRMALLAQGNAK